MGSWIFLGGKSLLKVAAIGQKQSLKMCLRNSGLIAIGIAVECYACAARKHGCLSLVSD